MSKEQSSIEYYNNMLDEDSQLTLPLQGITTHKFQTVHGHGVLEYTYTYRYHAN